MNDEQFDDLLARLLDGTLDEPDRTRLIEAASASETRAEALVNLLRLEPLLKDALAQDRDSAGFPRRVQTALRSPDDTPAFVAETLARLLDRDKQSSRPQASPANAARIFKAKNRYWIPSVLAASVAIAALGWVLSVYFGSSKVAEFEIVSGRSYLLEGDAAREITGSGSILRDQGIRCNDGSIRIRFADGSILELKQSGTIQRISDTHAGQRGATVILRDGELSATIQPQVKGSSFRVLTRSAEIKVVGTRFVVVEGADKTRLDVQEGLVELKRTADGEKVNVAGGYFAIAAPDVELTAKLNDSERLKDGRPGDDSAAFTAVSYLGGAGSDSVVGAAIQKDGTVVLAANFSGSAWNGITPTLLDGAQSSDKGVVVRLTPTGRTVLSIARVAQSINDLATDDSGAVYLALDTRGICKLDSAITRVVWQRPTDLPCMRLDAATDGTVVTLLKKSKSAGLVQLFTNDGAPSSAFEAPFTVNDVALDGVRKQIFVCGSRPGNTLRGEIGSVAYLNAYSVDGSAIWRNYGYEPAIDTDLKSHTSGERIAFGQDGKLYGAFLSVGGNHIFSRNPKSLDEKASLYETDTYNKAYATGNATITFVAQFDAENGDLLAGQMLLGRDEQNKASHLSPVNGNIATDEDGRVYLVGKASAGGPVTAGAIGTREYFGNSGFLCIFSPNLQRREFFSTFNASSEGGSALYAVAAKRTSTQARAAFAFGGSTLEASDKLPLMDAIQPRRSDEIEGFFGVRGIAPTEPNSPNK